MENILEAVLISNIKDYEKVIDILDKFLPYVNCWAVSDTIIPNIFKKNKDKLLTKINEYLKSNKVYEIRFGIKMLMTFYLDDSYNKKIIDSILKIKNDDYYVKMMKAWFFQVALFKKWEDTIYVLEENKLDTWTHNKAIQKCIESFRIDEKQKEYLRKLKRYE